jgi:hypothetical protein
MFAAKVRAGEPAFFTNDIGKHTPGFDFELEGAAIYS